MKQCWYEDPESRSAFDEVWSYFITKYSTFQLKAEIPKCLLLITNYYGYIEANTDVIPENVDEFILIWAIRFIINSFFPAECQ